MKYTEEIEAEVVVTARLAGGGISVRAAAVCEYQAGSTASAEVELPAETGKAVRRELEEGLKLVEHELGRRLSRARHEAARIGAAMGEVPPTGPAKAKGSKGTSGATTARRS